MSAATVALKGESEGASSAKATNEVTARPRLLSLQLSGET